MLFLALIFPIVGSGIVAHIASSYSKSVCEVPKKPDASSYCHNRSQNTLPIVMKRTSRGDKLTEEKMKDSKWFLHSSHARRCLYEYDLHAACNKFPCKNVTSGEKFAPRGSPFDGRCELSNVGWGEFWHGMSSLSHFMKSETNPKCWL